MNLNEQQKDIIACKGGKIAVIAGAGSGKTTTTMEFIVKLHNEDNIPLERMFVSTFTNKAGKDIKERLMKHFKISQEEIEKLWVGTFHSLGFRYLTRVRHQKLNVILPVEAIYLMKNIYRQVIKDEGEDEELISFNNIYESIEKKRNQNCPWEEILFYPNICEKVYNMYQREKEEQSLVDFTDILYLFSEELKKDKIFTNKFDWVFVDEAQDNCYLQHEIADLLTKKNSVSIGDHKQVLYKWRGATPELFKAKIKSADKVYPLSFNYRSTKEIINFANVLIKQIPSFKNQELIATGGQGEKPTFYLCDDLALQIYEGIKKDMRSGIPLEQIAVLSRSVKPQNIQNLLVFLRKDRIPYVVRGGDDKLNAHYIQNFLSVLKSIVNPTKISLLNSFSLLPGVGPKTAMTLAGEVSNANSFEGIKDSSGKYTQTKAFKDYTALKNKENDKKSLLNGALDFIYEHHLVHKYGKKDPKEPANKRTLIYDLLYNYLLSFNSISDGIDSLYLNEDDVEADKNKLIISTVHQSKGLEWDSVHIANMNEYAIPFINADEEGNTSKLEEEFCVAYVACTRAKKSLKMYMQYTTGTNTWSRTNKISRFIKEVYKKTKEQYFILRALDTADELAFKENIYRKACGDSLC